MPVEGNLRAIAPIVPTTVLVTKGESDEPVSCSIFLSAQRDQSFDPADFVCVGAAGTFYWPETYFVVRTSDIRMP